MEARLISLLAPGLDPAPCSRGWCFHSYQCWSWHFGRRTSHHAIAAQMFVSSDSCSKQRVNGASPHTRARLLSCPGKGDGREEWSLARSLLWLCTSQRRLAKHCLASACATLRFKPYWDNLNHLFHIFHQEPCKVMLWSMAGVLKCCCNIYKLEAMSMDRILLINWHWWLSCYFCLHSVL